MLDLVMCLCKYVFKFYRNGRKGIDKFIYSVAIIIYATAKIVFSDEKGLMYNS